MKPLYLYTCFLLFSLSVYAQKDTEENTYAAIW